MKAPSITSPKKQIPSSNIPTKLSLISPLLGLLLPTAASAAVSLTLNPYQGTGAREYTLSGASSSGATLTYDTKLGTRNDAGMVAPINSGSLTAFTQVGDMMTYGFRLSGITAQNNTVMPVYRVGFDFGSTATLRYGTSPGTGSTLRFGSNTNGNPFSSGTIHDTHSDWSPFALKDIRFDDGNEIDATVSLELVNIGGPSSYDYLMTVSYVSVSNPTDENTKSYTFTGVDGDQVVSLFHLTNASDMADGDAYTVSNASLEFDAVPEPSSIALLLAAMGGCCLRRRRGESSAS